MNHEDKTQVPESIASPTGLDLHPKPKNSLRVSKRAATIIGAVVLFLFLALAYGGYKRSKQAQMTAAQARLKAVGPALNAENEFTKGMPLGDAAVMHGQSHDSGKLKAVNKGCGSDPKTGQVYRFDPLTGKPCDLDASVKEHILIRRTSAPVQPRNVPVQRHEPTPEEIRIEEFYRREQEAMVAPTSIRSANSNSFSTTSFSAGGTAPTPQGDLAQVAALGAAISRQQSTDQPASQIKRAFLSSAGTQNGDYNSETTQSRKEQFLEEAASKKTEDYLQSTRSAPLSPYEIKAGWEIPAVLEQSLNSDLPGEVKALVMANVYDTATGMYLLVPLGSRLIGKYDSHVGYGQDGVQVIWSRLIFPDASSMDLAGMEGLDSHGNAGLRDKVDRHYKRLFGFAVLTSAFTAAFDISQRRSQSILATPNVSESASASVGREMSETGAQITRRNLNVQPTIKVPAGCKFTVRVNHDILFDSPYEPEIADPQGLPPNKELRRRTSY